MKQIGLALIGISFLIVACSISYYFVIHKPTLEKEKLKAETAIEKEKQRLETIERTNSYLQDTALDRCLEEAKLSSSTFWNKNCETYGTDKKSDDCRLPIEVADRVDDMYKNEEDLCFKRYK